MYSLRPATENDFEFLYQLHAATMREYIDTTWGWQESWQREYFRHKWDPRPRQIIQIDGADAGVIVVEKRIDEFYIGLIELLPAYQGQGVGTAVLQDVIARAATCPLPVSLHVLKSNLPALALYKRLGFKIIAEEELRYKLRRMP